MSKLKVGDSIVFLKPVRAGVEQRFKLLIPEFCPVVLLSLTTDHVTVEFDGEKIRLRNIPKRMAPAGDLAQVIFGR